MSLQPARLKQIEAHNLKKINFLIPKKNDENKLRKSQWTKGTFKAINTEVIDENEFLINL